MILVGLDDLMEERQRQAHRNALLTLPAHFQIVRTDRAELVVKDSPSFETRSILTGMSAAVAPRPAIGDSIVDWDIGIRELSSEVANIRDRLRAITVRTWSCDAAGLAIALATAHRLVGRWLPGIEDLAPTVARGHLAESHSWYLPATSAAATATVSNIAPLELEAHLVGDGLVADIRIFDQRQCHPTEGAITLNGETRVLNTRHSSAIREMWVAVAGTNELDGLKR